MIKNLNDVLETDNHILITRLIRKKLLFNLVSKKLALISKINLTKCLKFLAYKNKQWLKIALQQMWIFIASSSFLILSDLTYG
ncbi:hypothetical protein BpHYR1_051355 [Brachionus plicatilis]|uniref:Uncharacterized protein n=1 Tax=Brachionus plicatilis TaxID=10195 RepID=A0A3M7PVX2_BRAPC|nr:hypothetical protein BpHYR1_051355 [Brachionus plicatilis]